MQHYTREGRVRRCHSFRHALADFLHEAGEKTTGAQLTRQIPWLRVFVEGVVIVGKLEN